MYHRNGYFKTIFWGASPRRACLHTLTLSLDKEPLLSKILDLLHHTIIQYIPRLLATLDDKLLSSSFIWNIKVKNNNMKWWTEQSLRNSSLCRTIAFGFVKPVVSKPSLSKRRFIWIKWHIHSAVRIHQLLDTTDLSTPVRSYLGSSTNLGLQNVRKNIVWFSIIQQNGT